jgi:4-alpha-glucanotransferase
MTSRACGLLLHISSLPGRFDSGDMGSEARRFIDCLAASGVGWWQTLPIGPPGYGGSPYDSPSAFAGSTELISLESLSEGTDQKTGVKTGEGTDESVRQLLRQHYQARTEEVRRGDQERTREFRQEQRYWLEDHATFVALSGRFSSQHRHDWPLDVRTADGDAVAAAREQLADEIDFECWLQSLFARQWSELRRHASDHGVRLIGDMPIFVASHSADVWSHPELFELDDQARPSEVAAVPPDFFSSTGQLWGNPVYRWARHREDDFEWWRQRVRQSLERFDLLRIDHFRGLVANWRVQAGAETAEHGHWARAPGRQLWRAFENDPDLPLSSADGWPTLFAEDLGHITPAVRRMLKHCGLWGTRVLQFTDGKKSEHHPHNQKPETVYYTGTHDNNTTRGYVDSLADSQQHDLSDLFGIDPDLDARLDAAGQVRALVESALESAARLVVLPLQDVLGQGSEARMNTPGTTQNNWSYRAPAELLPESCAEWLADAAAATRRSSATQGSPR